MIPYHRRHTSYNLWWVEGAAEKQGKVAPPPWVRPYAHIKRTANREQFIGLKMSLSTKYW
nr:MAG TPA: hypothetical protein [Caudoviricetes sp.]